MKDESKPYGIKAGTCASCGPKSLRPCDECGNVFAAARNGRYCTTTCATRAERRRWRHSESGRAARRAQKARARARVRARGSQIPPGWVADGEAA